MKIRSALKFTGILILWLILTGCSSSEVTESSSSSSAVNVPSDAGYYEFLGNIDYSTDAAALVWEQVDGEDPGIYGIQYRNISDFNGLTSQSEIPVVIYFYSSAARGSQSLTAGVEDLAQTLVGQVLFLAVDGVEADAISTAYEVGSYPEFILIRDNARISTFTGDDMEEWDIDDVTAWIEQNGYEPDTSMLLR